jgi:hypothetical protein
VKANIKCDIKLGVIEPIPCGEPIEWCSQMFSAREKYDTPITLMNLPENPTT